MTQKKHHSSPTTADTKKEKHSEEPKPQAQPPGETSEEKQISVSAKAWDELQDKLQKTEEKVLRLAADFENSKKRIQSRSDEMVKFANEKLLLDTLTVVDDLDRAISSLDQGHELKNVKDGMHMVQNTFHKILKQNGIQVIDCLGKAFDPHLHEAVGEVVDDQCEEGHIVEEVQRGYLLNGRLARPSRVRVAKKAS